MANRAVLKVCSFQYSSLRVFYFIFKPHRENRRNIHLKTKKKVSRFFIPYAVAQKINGIVKIDRLEQNAMMRLSNVEN